MPQDAADAIFADDFSDLPWWWRAAPPSEGERRQPPAATDVLIVGGGFAGLCCAVECARAGADVTVVDTGAIGGGASTRAAGFVSGRAGVSKQINLTAAVGAERAAQILNEADEAFEHLRDALSVDGVDCDFQPTGRFVGANSPAGYAALEQKIAEYDRDGRGRFRMIPHAEQPSVVRTDRLFGGALIENGGLVDPAKYHAGLVRLCHAAGVRFVPHTRVEAIVSEGPAKRVLTSGGEVAARHVALGTGGYTDKAAPWHRRRIIPIKSTLIATERFDPALVRHLLPAGTPMIDSKRVINLVRPTAAGDRLLFGGRARFYPLSPAATAQILHGQMRAFFPELAGVKVVNAWSGLMAFTFDFLPKLGRHEGVHYALACNGGAGIVMMSWLGRKMAWNILGGANRESAFQGLPFKTQPFYAGAPWFLPIVGEWYRLRDWIDQRAADRARRR